MYKNVLSEVRNYVFLGVNPPVGRFMSQNIIIDSQNDASSLDATSNIENIIDEEIKKYKFDE